MQEKYFLPFLDFWRKVIVKREELERLKEVLRGNGVAFKKANLSSVPIGLFLTARPLIDEP